MKPLAGPLPGRLRKYFVGGLLVLIPLFLTLWIVTSLFRLFSGFLAAPIGWLLGDTGILEQPLPLLEWAGVQVGDLVPLLSLVALFLLIILTGVIARNYLGSRLFALGESIMARIPIIRRIYLAVQQISQALFSDRADVFRRAVMIEYPRKGIWSVGFVTSDSEGELEHGATVEPHYHIFLPTTPNPTSGFMLIVPKSDCIDLDMPVQEALKLVISGGAVTPHGLHSAQAEPLSAEPDDDLTVPDSDVQPQPETGS
jgi:uncharacterized membrane protein